MNSGPIRIALPKLFLWGEPTRIQEYPEALSRAEEGRVYTRVEVERELFDIAPTLTFKGGAPRGRRTDGIVNAYGLERSGARYRINGLNLLQKGDGGVTATEEGLLLGRLFQEHPDSDAWPRELARQLLFREPRTRLLIGLLLQGYTLEVALSGSTPTGPVAFLDSDRVRTVITLRGSTAFNALLKENSAQALGLHWKSDLARLEATGAVQLEGVQSKEPSTNNLPTALKKALAVLFHVGLLEGDGNHWTTDAGLLAARAGQDVVRSFGLTPPLKRKQLTDADAFAQALTETADAEGYVIVSRLVDRFGGLLDVPRAERALALDSFVRGEMYYGRLRVLECHPGQPRMGRGLFGASDSRRIRIDFDRVGNPAPNTNRTDAGPDQAHKRHRGVS